MHGHEDLFAFSLIKADFETSISEFSYTRNWFKKKSATGIFYAFCREQS